MAELVRLELLGLPCSGKSYLAAAAGRSPRVRSRLAEKAKRPARILEVLGTAVRNPALLGTFRTLGRVKPRNLAGQARAVFRFASRYREMTEAAGPAGLVDLVDEGMVQATWGLFLQPSLDRGASVDRSELERVAARFWPSRDSGCAVLFLDTPREEILKRSSARAANHPFTGIQISGNSTAEAVGIELLHKIRDLCQELGLLLSPAESRKLLGEAGVPGKPERP